MVENERECSQLREYLSTMHIAEQQGLSKGGVMLMRLLKNYFRWKSGMNKVSKNLFNRNDKESVGRDVNSNNREGMLEIDILYYLFLNYYFSVVNHSKE